MQDLQTSSVVPTAEAPVNLSLPFPHKEICSSQENMQLTIEKTLLGWYDIPTMKAYKDALSKFAEFFKSCSHSDVDKWIVGSDKNLSKPNGLYHRTRRGIVMEVSTSSNSAHVNHINRLCTPFGEVKLFGMGPPHVSSMTSRTLLAMICEIGSLTLIDNSDLGYHALNLSADGNSIYSAWGHSGESWLGAGDVVKHYLVSFNDDLAFSSLVNIEPADVDVFGKFNGHKNSHDQDSELFLAVTEGTNCFCA